MSASACVSPAFWEEAAHLDTSDSLAQFRLRFASVDGRVYLDGNSLGLLSHDAEAAVLRVLDEWRTWAVEGWTDTPAPWFMLAESLAARVAPLVGAEAEAVAVTGSTTVNLHQLLATLYEPVPNHTKILVDALNFPSDRYAVESHLRLRGLDPQANLVVVPSRDGRTLDEDDIIAHLTPEIQMMVLPSVLYASGQLLDMERVTREARQRGILVGWDCSHSIGAVAHELDRWGADFAFWCHYKYLNAGPGAVGGLYLNRRHWCRAPGLAGWWGSDKQKQFDMDPAFAPAGHAGGLQIGTPPILALAPLEGALAIHHEAGMERLRTKSLAQTAFLRRLVKAELAPWNFGFATPAEDTRRGGHLSLIHPDAARLAKALRAANVVPDFRAPDILRLAPAPLYTSFADLCEAVARLKEILQTGAYQGQESGRGLVP